MSRWARVVGAALLGCIEREPGDPPPALVTMIERGHVADVVKAAAYHRVTGYVDHHLLRADLPMETLAATWARSELVARYHGRVVEELRHVSSLLAASEIPMITMKGPLLSEHYHGSPGRRVYRDLDVLVPPTNYLEAVRILELDGYEVRDRNWRMIRRDLVGQLHVTRERHPPIDLHWHILYNTYPRQFFHVGTDELFARARPVRVGGVDVLTFDDIDTLLHLCLHACREGIDCLVWLLDVELVLAKADIDWDELVDRALSSRLHLVVATVLLKAAGTFGTTVPAGTLARLAPRPWLDTFRLLNRVFPLQTSRGTGDLSSLLARSTLASPRTTIGSARENAIRRARSAVRERTTARRHHRLDPDHAGSAMYEAGGELEREAYFRAVADEGQSLVRASDR